jgi:uncharacterized protein (DUF1697 family)
MMQNYIAILRGINVSGQKKILMEDLRDLLKEMKLQDAKTYIQSGNIVFKSEGKLSNEKLAAKIESGIKKKFGFDVPVIVRSEAEWKKAMASNPFLKDKKANPERMYITFLSAAPEKKLADDLRSFSSQPDQFHIAGSEIFLHCPVSYGETKLSNNFFEKKLKVKATTRNWKTVNALLEMCK